MRGDDEDENRFRGQRVWWGSGENGRKVYNTSSFTLVAVYTMSGKSYAMCTKRLIMRLHSEETPRIIIVISSNC